jgi:hypothetical protein
VQSCVRRAYQPDRVDVARAGCRDRIWGRAIERSFVISRLDRRVGAAGRARISCAIRQIRLASAASIQRSIGVCRNFSLPIVLAIC